MRRRVAHLGHPSKQVINRGNGTSILVLRGHHGIERGRAVIDTADLPLARQYRWLILVHKDGHRYARAHVLEAEGGSRMIYLHRLLMEPGPDQIVDHIDGDGLNCRRSNMRVIRGTENQQNIPSRGARNSRSQYRGVSYHKASGRWWACATLHKKRHSLGYFSSEDEAGQVAAAWRAANMPYSPEALGVQR